MKSDVGDTSSKGFLRYTQLPASWFMNQKVKHRGWLESCLTPHVGGNGYMYVVVMSTLDSLTSIAVSE